VMEQGRRGVTEQLPTPYGRGAGTAVGAGPLPGRGPHRPGRGRGAHRGRGRWPRRQRSAGPVASELRSSAMAGGHGSTSRVRGALRVRGRFSRRRGRTSRVGRDLRKLGLGRRPPEDVSFPVEKWGRRVCRLAGKCQSVPWATPW
jgi:hypothetical protein